MTKVVAAIQRTDTARQPVTYEPSHLRPGWVYEVVVAVLVAAEQPLRPQDVIRRAERLCGQRVAPSSIRNALRVASQREHEPIERLGYGTYRLRRDR
jgi:hypothetical protein